MYFLCIRPQIKHVCLSVCLSKLWGEQFAFLAIRFSFDHGLSVLINSTWLCKISTHNGSKRCSWIHNNSNNLYSARNNCLVNVNCLLWKFSRVVEQQHSYQATWNCMPTANVIACQSILISQHNDSLRAPWEGYTKNWTKIAKHASDVVTQTRLRQTNWNSEWFWRFL